MGWYARTICYYWRFLVIFFTPIFLLPLAVIGATDEARCGYVILVMVIYWVTDAPPQAATSFIPIFAFPLLGILSTDDTCLAYLKEPNMLFLAGVAAVIGTKDSLFNKRFAIAMILKIGPNPRRLLAGVMIVTMLLGMWINIALITGMMVAMVDELLKALERDLQKNKKEDLIIPKITITDMENGKEISLGEVNPTFELEVDDEHGIAELAASEGYPNHVDMESHLPEEPKELYDMERFKKCLFISVPYSALVARTAVIVGTPPNLVLADLMKGSFSEQTELTFISWIAFFVPTMLICNFLGWIWLQAYFIGLSSRKTPRDVRIERDNSTKVFMQSEYKELGPVSFHQKVIITAFLFLFTFWVFKYPWNFPGWIDPIQNAFGGDVKIEHSTSFMLIIFFMMVIPQKFSVALDPSVSACKKERIDGCLPWQSINDKLPWSNMLLIGSSLAIGDACNRSGLTRWMGQELTTLHDLPGAVIIFIVTIMACVITNVPTNKTTADMFVPAIMKLSLSLCINPLYMTIPVTFCCSLGFLLPCGHPSNSIAYVAAKLNPMDMIKAGLGMTIICIVVVNIMINTLGTTVFKLHQNLPPWVNSTTDGFLPLC